MSADVDSMQFYEHEKKFKKNFTSKCRAVVLISSRRHNARSAINKYIHTMIATEQLITLKHGQTIRGAGFSKYAQRITVRTVRGYRAEYNEDQEEAYNRAVANGHETFWTRQDSAVLCSDYPGKAEAHAAKLKEIAEAIELFDGQEVIIENEKLIVRIMGERFSDPIVFINLNLDI